jgi:acetyl-CoA C-acetyltransferase
MKEAVVVDAVRTPIGKRKGALRERRPDRLYADVIDALLRRTGLDRAKVDDVITGCVTQVGEQGVNVGRLGVLLSNLGQGVPGTTVNRMCGSSQQTIHFAAQGVAAGDLTYAIAGGVESMTRVPMFGDIGGGFERLDPDLLEKYDLVHQGESAELVAECFGLARRELDEFSCESHRRAAQATREGRFCRQLVPVPGVDGDGKPIVLEHDEGIRFEIDLAKMAALPLPFRPAGNGVVTAANSSQISDGAAALLIGDREVATADGFRPRARFRARVAVAGDPTLQLMEVIPATRRALDRAGLCLSDLDVIEINEAFASVVVAWARELKPDLAKVNPNGGAIALGHPLGATGAVLATKLIDELERSDGQFGLQVMCIGHGMATATVYERI